MASRRSPPPSHKMTSPFCEPLASSPPSCENARVYTADVWPSSSSIASSVRVNRSSAGHILNCTQRGAVAVSVEVQWTDADPDTGEKRFIHVERFAGKWTFYVRARRRENWVPPPRVTRDMW